MGKERKVSECGAAAYNVSRFKLVVQLQLNKFDANVVRKRIVSETTVQSQ
jgi:hypothetical protein